MILVIIGPTGVGKSALSIALAKKYNASIINADATQVYKDANIGTAKITEEEKCSIPHYMMDMVSLDDNYTVRDYQIDARKILDKLLGEGKNVIIVGGSGLYTKALLYDYQFTDEEEIKTYDDLTNKELKDKVDSIYKDNNIHINNRKRLERFLSHYEVTGEIIKNSSLKDKALYDFTLIGLNAPRDILYDKLNKRVDEMIDNGLINEVEKLKGKRKTKDLIGYKEIISYLDGNISLDESIELIKKNTRKYAKRQMTWYNHQFDNIKWFIVDYNNFNNTIKKVEDYLK